MIIILLIIYLFIFWGTCDVCFLVLFYICYYFYSDVGGYNLQSAWTTGYIAGVSCAQSFTNEEEDKQIAGR